MSYAKHGRKSQRVALTQLLPLDTLGGMCRRVQCPKCKKASWAGCGAHVEQVLAGVPAAEIDALVADRVIVEGKPFVLQALVNYR